MKEEEMVGWHHKFNGHELEQTAGDGEGQGSLACCSPWGCKEQLNNNKKFWLSSCRKSLPFLGATSFHENWLRIAPSFMKKKVTLNQGPRADFSEGWAQSQVLRNNTNSAIFLAKCWQTHCAQGGLLPTLQIRRRRSSADTTWGKHPANSCSSRKWVSFLF